MEAPLPPQALRPAARPTTPAIELQTLNSNSLLAQLDQEHCRDPSHRLPQPLFVKVLQHLPLRDVVECMVVCEAWNRGVQAMLAAQCPCKAGSPPGSRPANAAADSSERTKYYWLKRLCIWMNSSHAWHLQMFLWVSFLVLLPLKLDNITDPGWFIVFLPIWCFDGTLILTYFTDTLMRGAWWEELRAEVELMESVSLMNFLKRIAPAWLILFVMLVFFWGAVDVCFKLEGYIIEDLPWIVALCPFIFMCGVLSLFTLWHTLRRHMCWHASVYFRQARQLEIGIQLLGLTISLFLVGFYKDIQSITGTFTSPTP